MAERQLSTPQGLLRLQASDEAFLDAAAQLAKELATSEAKPSGPVEFAGIRAYLKGGPLGPGSARRHGLRRLFLRAAPPRLAEYHNLSWLHERLFETPEPLAAGVLLRGAKPRYQFLLTRELQDAQPMEQSFPSLPAQERQAVLQELAREVARMHSLHFVHRDLYPRNLMLRPAGSNRRVIFLDAWAGGPGPGRRGPSYDMGCLFLEGCMLFTPEEQEQLLELYFDERRRQERPADRAAFLALATQARDALWQQLQRDPGRRRGRPIPPQHWSPS